MEKTKDGIKRTLRENYAMVCNGYLAELLRMWELDARYGYWVGGEVGDFYCYGGIAAVPALRKKYLTICAN